MNECNKSGRLSAYLDHELNAEEMAAMDRHVARCPVCSAILGELRSTVTRLHAAAPPALSAVAMGRLHDRVNEWNRRGAQRFAGLLSGLAACLAIASALSMLRAGHAAPAPLPWEAVAAHITDDAAAPNSRESLVAEWMVADLAHGSADGE